MTQPGLEPKIYRTRDEHVNHYTTDAVASRKTDNTMAKDEKMTNNSADLGQ